MASNPSERRELGRSGMIALGIAIVLVAVLAGSFIHPLLFLLGLAVLFVAAFGEW